MITSFSVPILSSFLLPGIGRLNKEVRNVIALLCILFPLAAVSLMGPTVLAGNKPSVDFSFALGIDITFRADILGWFMAMVSLFISTLILLYSWSYISHYENQNEYYFMVILFSGSMTGLIFSSNLIVLYTFWELTAFASYRLIGFFRKEKDVKNADKSFLITVAGALLMFIGFIILYVDCGSFDFNAIKTFYSSNPVPLSAVILILCGMFSKSAMLPFQSWLPDAGVAPSPVTALLHAAVLVKIGVYAFARIFIVTIALTQDVQVVVQWCVAGSALVSAGAALVETDLKRIIAYSTISQLSFIFLGLATGTGMGIMGGILSILMHGLAKAGLFLCAGIIEQNTGTKDIREMGGLIKTMPITAVAFGLCALSIMGVPPFGGFFSKYMVITGTFYAGNLAIGLVFVFGALLTILYLLRVFSRMFFGETGKCTGTEKSPLMVGCVLTFGVLSLIAGIGITVASSAAVLATTQITGL